MTHILMGQFLWTRKKTNTLNESPHWLTQSDIWIGKQNNQSLLNHGPEICQTKRISIHALEQREEKDE